MMDRPWPLAVITTLVGLALTFAGCSGQSAAEASLNQAVATTTASSFHAVQTIDQNSAGEAINGRVELYYQAPDRYRGTSDLKQIPVSEIVVIGNQAWTRSSSGWSRSDAEHTLQLLSAPIDGVRQLRNHKELKDEGSGPTIGGELTQRYQLLVADYGARMAAGLDEAARTFPADATALAAIKKTYDSVEAKAEIFVGQSSDRIYLVKMSISGPSQNGQIEITIDYDHPVTIEPPG